VSGYQLRFSSDEIFTPGDACDVLVAMNAAALKVNLTSLKRVASLSPTQMALILKNLRLANYPEGRNPIEDNSLDSYEVIKMDVTKMTREALKDISMGMKEKDRAKNMFVLGFLYWMYNREMNNTIEFLRDKFGKKQRIFESNVKALQAGYNFGDTTETFRNRYSVAKAKMTPVITVPLWQTSIKLWIDCGFSKKRITIVFRKLSYYTCQRHSS
jgi:2-oxoglutarate ferredoxin oxidoreductase subunit alpha